MHVGRGDKFAAAGHRPSVDHDRPNHDRAGRVVGGLDIIIEHIDDLIVHVHDGCHHVDVDDYYDRR
ncbi:MAG: hypothetical protein M3P52_07670 [Actinomycetota bacterium]|nr:hypothetical protein [Actinomycetota bacterium]